MKRTALVIITCFFLIPNILQAVTYKVYNGKLMIQPGDNTEGIVITRQTLIDALLSYQTKMEELELKISKRDREIEKLKKDHIALEENFVRFKNFYFRSF